MGASSKAWNAVGYLQLCSEVFQLTGATTSVTNAVDVLWHGSVRVYCVEGNFERSIAHFSLFGIVTD